MGYTYKVRMPAGSNREFRKTPVLRKISNCNAPMPCMHAPGDKSLTDRCGVHFFPCAHPHTTGRGVPKYQEGDSTEDAKDEKMSARKPHNARGVRSAHGIRLQLSPYKDPLLQPLTSLVCPALSNLIVSKANRSVSD